MYASKKYSLQNKVGKIYLYVRAFLLKQLFQSRLLARYEMILVNSALQALQASFAIDHLISSASPWNNRNKPPINFLAILFAAVSHLVHNCRTVVLQILSSKRNKASGKNLDQEFRVFILLKENEFVL